MFYQNKLKILQLRVVVLALVVELVLGLVLGLCMVNMMLENDENFT